MRKSYWLIIGAISVIAWQTCFAAPAGKKPVRAKPPQKRDKDVLRIFPENPRSQLVGERPDFGKHVAASKASVQPSVTPGAPAPGPATSSGWSALISRDTLADEVKSYQPLLAKSLTKLSTFNGGGFREARLYYSMIAVAMAITAEHEGDVRWKDQAAGARDLFARAGANLKVASDASFKEAKLRMEDLATLVRGGNIEVKPAEKSVTWDKVSDFTLLMNRLDIAHKERLTKFTSNEAEFKSNADAALHEAQIIAAMAVIIQKDGYDYAGDSSFAGIADEMKQAALETVAAVNSNNYDSARTAVGAVYQACEKCHGDYR